MKDDQERLLYATLGVVLATLGLNLIIVPLASFAVRLFFSFESFAALAVKLFRQSLLRHLR